MISGFQSWEQEFFLAAPLAHGGGYRAERCIRKAPGARRPGSGAARSPSGGRPPRRDRPASAVAPLRGAVIVPCPARGDFPNRPAVAF